MYDYLIVGAGLYGAVVAHEMTKHGKSCLVIDKRLHIGGNIFTENVEGITVHRYGAHIFHTDDKEIWDYITQFAVFNHFINCPIAVYKDKVYNLPFNMNTFAQMWGRFITPDEAEGTIKLLAESEHITDPKNLEEQAISLVGREIYEKLIKGYTEKQWGLPCSDLPPSIIKRIPLRFTYDNNYFDDKYQGIPVGGYTQIISRMLAGSDVLLGTDYHKMSGKRNIAYVTVYTGSIDEMYDYKYGPLDYRTLSFSTKILDKKDYQGNAVVNYTGAEVPYTRIIEHKHFERGTQSKTVITKEYPARYVAGYSIPYYPINTEKNDALYARYMELAKADTNIVFGGRLGLYRYMDMDDTIKSALKLSKRLIEQPAGGTDGKGNKAMQG